jgi:hypothetical protein
MCLASSIIIGHPDHYPANRLWRLDWRSSKQLCSYNGKSKLACVTIADLHRVAIQRKVLSYREYKWHLV